MIWERVLCGANGTWSDGRRYIRSSLIALPSIFMSYYITDYEAGLAADRGKTVNKHLRLRYSSAIYI